MKPVEFQENTKQIRVFFKGTIARAHVARADTRAQDFLLRDRAKIARVRERETRTRTRIVVKVFNCT